MAHLMEKHEARRAEAAEEARQWGERCAALTHECECLRTNAAAKAEEQSRWDAKRESLQAALEDARGTHSAALAALQVKPTNRHRSTHSQPDFGHFLVPFWSLLVTQIRAPYETVGCVRTGGPFSVARAAAGGGAGGGGGSGAKAAGGGGRAVGPRARAARRQAGGGGAGGPPGPVPGRQVSGAERGGATEEGEREGAGGGTRGAETGEAAPEPDGGGAAGHAGPPQAGHDGPAGRTSGGLHSEVPELPRSGPPRCAQSLVTNK
eukprot:831061-Prorocentrum_minimum.AAC.2